MFTGLIEEIGLVQKKMTVGDGLRFSVKADAVMNSIAVGDSISVNGVCQTVVEIRDNVFSFDTVEETIKKTTLGEIETNTSVNLERALKADSRLGGHFVLGHVDCVGRVKSITHLSGSSEVVVSYPAEYAKFIIPIGSIAVDGVSLTVADVTDNSFKVAVIPHTWKSTVFGMMKVGQHVNLEFDVLGKYVDRIMNFKSPQSKITEAWLREQGF